MKKIASIYLNVLLVFTMAILFLTLAYTLIVGHSPYETFGIDPGLGAIVTLGGIALLFCVPHFLNRDFTSRRSPRSLRIKRGKSSVRPTIR